MGDIAQLKSRLRDSNKIPAIFQGYSKYIFGYEKLSFDIIFTDVTSQLQGSAVIRSRRGFMAKLD